MKIQARPLKQRSARSRRFLRSLSFDDTIYPTPFSSLHTPNSSDQCTISYSRNIKCTLCPKIYASASKLLSVKKKKNFKKERGFLLFLRSLLPLIRCCPLTSILNQLNRIKPPTDNPPQPQPPSISVWPLSWSWVCVLVI